MSDKLNDYLSAWNLSDAQLLAETATSHVYTVTCDGVRVVLKLLTPIGKEEQKGAIALRCFDGQGAVRLLRSDEQAHLLEYADGDDLTGMVKNGKDSEATAIIADALNKLHGATYPTPTTDLTPLTTWFRSLFKKADQDQRSGQHSIFVRAAFIAQSLLADPRDVRVLHGDVHHENIRQHPQRGWLAFDPKGLLGERTFDTANTLCNPFNMPQIVYNEARVLANIEIFAQKLAIDPARILSFLFAYACLSATWLSETNQDFTGQLTIARIVEPHLRM